MYCDYRKCKGKRWRRDWFVSSIYFFEVLFKTVLKSHFLNFSFLMRCFYIGGSFAYLCKVEVHFSYKFLYSAFIDNLNNKVIDIVSTVWLLTCKWVESLNTLKSWLDTNIFIVYLWCGITIPQYPVEISRESLI